MFISAMFFIDEIDLSFVLVFEFQKAIDWYFDLLLFYFVVERQFLVCDDEAASFPIGKAVGEEHNQKVQLPKRRYHYICPKNRSAGKKIKQKHNHQASDIQNAD